MTLNNILFLPNISVFYSGIIREALITPPHTHRETLRHTTIHGMFPSHPSPQRLVYPVKAEAERGDRRHQGNNVLSVN